MCFMARDFSPFTSERNSRVKTSKTNWIFLVSLHNLPAQPTFPFHLTLEHNLEIIHITYACTGEVSSVSIGSWSSFGVKRQINLRRLDGYKFNALMLLVFLLLLHPCQKRVVIKWNFKDLFAPFIWPSAHKKSSVIQCWSDQVRARLWVQSILHFTQITLNSPTWQTSNKKWKKRHWEVNKQFSGLLDLPSWQLHEC